MKYHNFHRPHRPAQKNGHLYYARLKTPLGIFYKLGFTSLESLAKRLAFQGTGDDALIDEVLYFVYHENAYDLETTLHAHFTWHRAFSVYSAQADMPLCGNGQSELYYDDILGLDGHFTQEQADETRTNVQLAILMRTCASKEAALKQKAADEAQARLIEGISSTLRSGLLGIAAVINFLFGTRLLKDPDTSTEVHVPDALAMIHRYKADRESRRIERSNELHRLRKEAREEMARKAGAVAQSDSAQS